MKKRQVRLPRSNEGGMLLDMPHSAYLAGAFDPEDQRFASACPVSQLAVFAVTRLFT